MIFYPSRIQGQKGPGSRIRIRNTGSKYTFFFFSFIWLFQDPFVQSGKAATRIRRWLRLSEVSWLLQYHRGFINSLDRTYIVPKYLLDFLEKKTSQRRKIRCRACGFLSHLYLFSPFTNALEKTLTFVLTDFFSSKSISMSGVTSTCLFVCFESIP